MSLYKLKEEDPIYPAHEHDAICINSEDILNKNTAREVYAHPFEHTKLMCVSPNNAAFYVGLQPPIIAFYGCCVITYGKDYGRLMIALYDVE